jgi:hypothetical protein
MEMLVEFRDYHPLSECGRARQMAALRMSLIYKLNSNID